MDWRDRFMIPGRLRLRFMVAAGLLVLTTVTASVWTFFALTRLSGVVTETVQQSESVTAVTSRLAGALEREDDAVLLILAGDDRGSQVLAGERLVVDKAVSDLFDVLGPEDERELASPLQTELRAYRQASDGVVSGALEREALVQYHQKANPVLRRAVALTTTIRDRHFELARGAVAGARDEAAAARRAVLVITLAALIIAVAVAWHLTRTVVGPVRRLTEGANAIRGGNFSGRIDVASRDELGELAGAFNQMAEDLSEFRRTNISEVVRAKNTLEATLEALPDAVVLLDGAGQVQSMNRAAVNALASAGVHEPRRLDDLRVEGLDLNAITRAISAGSGIVPPADLTRTIRVEQDGGVQRLMPRVVPVPTLNPQQRGAVLLLYDVTDLVRLDEMRSELVAVASHELQTPLTTLRMTLLMLQESSELLPERQRQLVATSLIGVEQLTEIVHEFLDLTRIEAGELRTSS
jgi:NtrC-family two-component system sensor histidine kinase KinB